MKIAGKKLKYTLFIYVLCLQKLFSQEMDSLADQSFSIKILRQWELPPALKEVSGLAYLDAERLACVEDETGAIFIYNTRLAEIEKLVPFGPPGDYEGIATVGDDAYIACADGRIYEVHNFQGEKPLIKEYGTHLTVRHNMAGIAFDRKNNRMLVCIKGHESGSPRYKGIYSFDLSSKAMAVKPPVKIHLEDPAFIRNRGKNIQSVIFPSDIDIHPLTQDIFITDGRRSQILVLDVSGKIKALFALDKKEVVQPEGICFTPSGELFIASKGQKQEAARLLLVQLP